VVLTNYSFNIFQKYRLGKQSGKGMSEQSKDGMLTSSTLVLIYAPFSHLFFKSFLVSKDVMGTKCCKLNDQECVIQTVMLYMFCLQGELC